MRQGDTGRRIDDDVPAEIRRLRQGGLERGSLLLSGEDHDIRADLSADTIRIGAGRKRLYRQSFTGDLVLEPGAVLEPVSGVWGELIVRGDVENRGVIRNRTSGSNPNLYLEVAGNIDNRHGSWTNNRTRVFWDPIAGATAYEYAMTADPGNWPAATTSAAPVTKLISDKLSTVWYWRTRGLVNGVWTEWSEHTINVPVATPTATPTPVPTATPTPSPVPNTPPVITLQGDNPLTLTVGDVFAEPGFAATDGEDGEITEAVDVTVLRQEAAGYTVAETVETAVPGTYSLVYSVADAESVSAVATRSVVVLAKPTLTFSAEEAFKIPGTDPENPQYRGTDKVKATADEEAITFKVVYTDGGNPEHVSVKLNVEEQVDFSTPRYSDRIAIFNYDGQGIEEATDSDGTKYSRFGPLNNGSKVWSAKQKKGISLTLVVEGDEYTAVDVQIDAFNSSDNIVTTVTDVFSIPSGQNSVTHTIGLQSNNQDISYLELKLPVLRYYKVYLRQVALLEEIPLPSITDAGENPPVLHNGKYADKEEFSYTQTFPQGKYHYWFEAFNGRTKARLPEEQHQGNGGETLAFETGYSNVVFLPGILASRLYAETINDKPCTGTDCQVWEPTPHDQYEDIDPLFLNDQGESIRQDITAREVIDKTWGDFIGNAGPNNYYSFLQSLQQWKEEGNINNFAAIPYDWRLDFDQLLDSGEVTTAGINFTKKTKHDYIQKQVEELASTSANGKVTLVAHSMGGLISKLLISRMAAEGKAKLFDSLILVASPQLGTPATLGGLLQGDAVYMFNEEDWGIDLFEIVDDATAREFGLNMQSSYNLLPSETYMERVKQLFPNGSGFSKPWVIEFDGSLDNLQKTIALRDNNYSFYHTTDPTYLVNYRETFGNKIDEYTNLKKYLLGNDRLSPPRELTNYPAKLNPVLLQKAEVLHSIIDNWKPPQDENGENLFPVIQIAGWGIPSTIAQLKYVAKKAPISAYAKLVDGNSFTVNSKDIYELDPQPDFTMDGDGTVVLPSAIAMRDVPGVETYYVDLKKHNIGLPKNLKHSSIFEVNSIRELINRITLHEEVNVKESPKDINSDSKLEFIYKYQPPNNESYIRLALHSPVSIDIYDSEGNHTGLVYDPDSPTNAVSTEEQIPNSYYMEFGEGKYLGIPADSMHRI